VEHGDRAVKISENIHVIDFDWTETFSNYVYLIKDQDEAVLIDAHIGPESENLLQRIREIIEPSKLKTVILTHGHMDHMGACPTLQEKTKARIAAHIADAQYIEAPWTQFTTLYQDYEITPQAYQDFMKMVGGKGSKVTNPLHGGETIKVGSIELHIVHIPGHSPGSIYIHEPDTKTIFTGDALVPSHVYCTMLGIFQDATNYIQSLEHLSRLNVETICPGHAPILRGKEIKKELQIHFDRYHLLEKTLPEILNTDGMTLWEVYYELANRVLGSGEHNPGIGSLATVRGFLNKLSAEGKILQVSGSRWKPV
jgi:hydroxyacylglutathione hydrolase